MQFSKKTGVPSMNLTFRAPSLCTTSGRDLVGHGTGLAQSGIFRKDRSRYGTTLEK